MPSSQGVAGREHMIGTPKKKKEKKERKEKKKK
jgi:hypothetical protein